MNPLSQEYYINTKGVLIYQSAPENYEWEVWGVYESTMSGDPILRQGTPRNPRKGILVLEDNTFRLRPRPTK